MHATYATDVDALSIRLTRGIGHVVTREIQPCVYLDFDERQRLVGIEILDASSFYDRAELERLPPPGAQ
jgi:uncharacterized protein YuzE